MARQEQDREDLLREATALTERVELLLPDFDEPVFAGFRRDGTASFYFGQDFVVQFNSRGEVRRGFAEGRMLKAEAGRLVALERVRGTRATELRRTDLGEQESRQWCQTARETLARLEQAVAKHDYELVGQVSSDGGVIPRVLHWLEALPESLSIAARPHVR